MKHFNPGSIDFSYVIPEMWKSFSKYREQMLIVAGSIFCIIFAIQLFKAALELVMERQMTLVKKLIMYMIVSGMLIVYPAMTNMAFNMAQNYIFKSYDILNQLSARRIVAQNIIESFQESPGLFELVKKIVRGFTTALSNLLVNVILAFGDIMMFGLFFELAFLIVMGPLFIPFFMSEGTRQYFSTWFNGMLGSLMVCLAVYVSVEVSRIFYRICYPHIIQQSMDNIFSFWIIKDLFILAILPVSLIFAAMSLGRGIVGGTVSGAGAVMGPMKTAMGMGMGMMAFGSRIANQGIKKLKEGFDKIKKARASNVNKDKS